MPSPHTNMDYVLDLRFEPYFPGQVTPAQPPQEKDSVPVGTVMAVHDIPEGPEEDPTINQVLCQVVAPGVTIQRGSHGSLWIHLSMLGCQQCCRDNSLASIVSEAEQWLSPPAAIYVMLPEEVCFFAWNVCVWKLC